MNNPKVNVVVSGHRNEYHLTYKTYILRGGIPFADQVIMPYTKYVIKYDFDLGAFGTKTISFSSSNVSSVKTEEKMNLETAIAGGDEDKIKRAQDAYNTFGQDYYYYTEVNLDAHQALYLKGRIIRLNDTKTAKIPVENHVIYTGDTPQTIILGGVVPINPADVINLEEFILRYSNYIIIPDNSILLFEGGSIDNGTIVGTHTDIEANDSDVIFGKNILIGGTWKVNKIFDTWFDYSNNMVSNDIIKNMLALTDDNVDNVVRFARNTTYNVKFAPTMQSCLPTIYYLTDGTLVDEHGDPIPGSHADGSDADRAKLYWTPGGTTYNISRYLKYRKYPNDNTLYQKISGGPGIALYDPEVRDDLTLFYIKNNTKLVIDSTIQMLNHKFTNYYMFNITGKQNITFKGKGSILGEITSNYNIAYKYPHGSQSYEPYWMYYGEHAYLIMMAGAQNVTVEDITLAGSAGDCIYSNPDCTPYIVNSSAPNITRNIVIKNVIIDRARRNGITCCGVNVLIENVTFQNCGPIVKDEHDQDVYIGTPPLCGIDFESDFLHPAWLYNNQTLKTIARTFFGRHWNELGCSKVIMSDCKFINNSYDISSTTIQYHYGPDAGEPSNTHLDDFEPGAVTISDCNFTSKLRLNSTNCLRFRNCFIPNVTSYDNTTDPIAYSWYIDYENCRFGDEMSTRYFAYYNKAIGEFPHLRFDGCTGRSMHSGEELVFYSGLADSVIEIKIPFVYDLNTGSESFPYKINRGIVHVKIAQFCSNFTLRITECDITMHDFPIITNHRVYGGVVGQSAQEYSDYVSICSTPKVITDTENHEKYISFFVASGDILNRYYNYDTHECSDTPSGTRPYDSKEVLISFNYLGIPDERGNYIRSVRTGNWRYSISGSIYSGVDILCNRINAVVPTEEGEVNPIHAIDDYEFDFGNWTSNISLPAKMGKDVGSNEYVRRFPKILGDNGMPVNECYLVDRDVYAGLYTDMASINFNIFHSSRFGLPLINQGNIPVKLEASHIQFKKAMTKAELAANVLNRRYVTFESGQQVFITDEGENGTQCSLVYNPAGATVLFWFADALNILQDETLQLYVYGKLIEVNVHAGDEMLTVITAIRNAIINAFATEYVNDITTPIDPEDTTRWITGQIYVTPTADPPASTVIYIKYVNKDGVYNLSGGIYILKSVNNFVENLCVNTRLDDGQDFKVVKADGTLVTKFWT